VAHQATLNIRVVRRMALFNVMPNMIAFATDKQVALANDQEKQGILSLDNLLPALFSWRIFKMYKLSPFYVLHQDS